VAPNLGKGPRANGAFAWVPPNHVGYTAGLRTITRTRWTALLQNPS
jgi:hypothetical protein